MVVFIFSIFPLRSQLQKGQCACDVWYPNLQYHTGHTCCQFRIDIQICAMCIEQVKRSHFSLCSLILCWWAAVQVIFLWAFLSVTFVLLEVWLSPSLWHVFSFIIRPPCFIPHPRVVSMPSSSHDCSIKRHPNIAYFIFYNLPEHLHIASPSFSLHIARIVINNSFYVQNDQSHVSSIMNCVYIVSALVH